MHRCENIYIKKVRRMYAKILTVLTPRWGVGREKDFPQVIFFPFCLAMCSAISVCDSCQRVEGKNFF